MPVSLGEWRVRIGRFIHWVRENYITERKEKLLMERIRRLKLLEKRLLEKKGKSEDECEPTQDDSSVKVDNAPNESNIINNDTTYDSHKEDSSRNESTIKENTTQTESTTYQKSNGTDSFFFFFTLLLSMFSSMLSFILFFVFDFSNLLESYKPFLQWSGESSRTTCFIIIIVCSSLAYIVLSYVIKINEDLQDNLVLIGDENEQFECIIRANNTPTESSIKDRNTPTESKTKYNNTLSDSRIKEKNTTTESTKECNHNPTNATIKESNTPSTIRDGPSERNQSKSEKSKRKTIIENKSTTEFTTKENSTLPESTIKGRVAPTECHIDTLSCMTEKSSKRKTPKRKTLTSKRKTSKRKTAKDILTATETTMKANHSPTESNIKEDNTLSESTSKENITQTKSTLKDNNTITESPIKENNSPNEYNIEENTTTTGSTIKDNNSQTESTIKENNSPTEYIIKDNNSLTESTNNGKNNATEFTTKEKSPTESTIKFKNTSTVSTIKDNNTPTEFNIKNNNTPTESNTKENNTPSGSTIKENITLTESTIKENNTPTESTIEEKNTPTESTIKEKNTPTESNIKENNTPTESNIKENNTPTESTIKDNNSPSQSPIKDNNSPTKSTIKENSYPTEYTIKDSNSPTESTQKEKNTATELTNKEKSLTESTITGKSTITVSTIKDTNTVNESTINNTLTKATINYKKTQASTTTESKALSECTMRNSRSSPKSTNKKDSSLNEPAVREMIHNYFLQTSGADIKKTATISSELLLIQAGDVEMNPGPQDRSIGPLQERELRSLAQDVPPEYYYTLCIALGFTYARSKNILTKNLLDVYESVFDILCMWKIKQTDGSSCRRALVKILRREDLSLLASKLSQGTDYHQETTQEEPTLEDETQPLTKEQVDQCAQDFKTFYRTRLCKIKTDPLDFTSILEFERIYTNLVLLRNEQGTTKKTPLEYTELLTTRVNEVYPKRFMVEGEGGVGKTTFCSKIAWDWSKGTKEFEEFDWVLVIPLCNTKEGQTVGDIAKTYLSDSNTVQPCQIDKYILSAPSKVFIIFDGLDEYEGDILKESSAIAKILRSEQFVECRVLVTTRPWRAVPFKSHELMMQTFAFLALAGFDKENISTYITKYFQDEPLAGFELIKYIESNDLIQENMAPFPLYIAMLCILWRNSDADKRNIIRKLKTFSQLFNAMIIFLKDHCLTKQHQNHNVKVLTSQEINNYLLQIGQFAYFGVLKKRLTYTENDFSGYDEAMEACCRIGVLSREILIVPRQDRHLSETNPVTSSVFFPHKLFQEYLAGMYLASLFESDHEQYEKAINDVVHRAEEFRYLLYFTASRAKNVATDITNKLMDKKYDDILVDITFEAYDEDSAKVVGQHLFAKQKSLEINNKMSAHTVSGYLFIMGKLQMETLILSRRSCGPTASRDLADVICSSTALTALEFNGTALHDDFYGTLESKLKTSKVERLSLKLMGISDEHASHNLARVLNNLPRLKDLTLQDNSFDGQFYTELASGACSVEVERLSLISMEISEEHASRNLARFLNNLPRLNDLTLQDNRFDGSFYTELASGACSVEVEASGYSICKLHINHRFLSDLLQHGFTMETLFPNVEHLYFTTLQTVSPDIVESLAHSELKGLSFATETRNGKTKEDEECHVPLVGDPSSLEQAFLNTFPRLTNLTFHNLVIGNNRCKIILSSLKQHQHLKNLCVTHCYTDEEIDPTVSAINMENRMKVNIQHDQAQKHLKCIKMSSSLANALCHRTSIQELILTYATIFPDAWFPEENQRQIDSKIQKLDLRDCCLGKHDPTTSRDLARFLCLQPCLTDLTISNIKGQLWLHDNFYHEIAHSSFSSKVQKLSIRVSNLERNTPSASRDLARFLCLQPCLTDLTINGYNGCLHDDFYQEVASLASSSKIKKLSILSCQQGINDPSASRDLATFLCLQPCLTDLTINGYDGYRHDDFYQELARLASSSKVQKLSIGGCNLEINDPSASRDLARFLCLQPCLIDLAIQDGSRDYSKIRLQDEFYHELSRLAPFSKVQKLFMGDCNLNNNDPTASRDLVRFLCLQPCLVDLTINRYNACLLDDFYQELACLASSSKVQKLSIGRCNLKRNKPSASRDLAKFLCLQPCLTDLTILYNIYLHDVFYQELARLASSSKASQQIEKVCIDGCNLGKNHPTASCGLSRFLCLLPCLTDLTIKDSDDDFKYLYFHDDFYHELALHASSSKIGKLCVEDCNLKKNDPMASRAFAKFLCLLPCLTDLTMRGSDELWLHDNFYHELAFLASSSKNPFFTNNMTWTTWYNEHRSTSVLQVPLAALHLTDLPERLPSQFEQPNQHGTWQYQDINRLSESVVSLESSVMQQSIDSPSPGPVHSSLYQEEEQTSYSSYQQFAQFIPDKQRHSNILVPQPLPHQIEPSMPQETQQIHRYMAEEQYTSQEALQSSHEHQQPLDHSNQEFMTTQPTNHQNAHFTSLDSVGLQRSFSPSRMSPQLPSQFEQPDQHGTWQHQDINRLSESVVSLESSVTQQSIDSPSPGPVQASLYQEEEQPSYSSYQQFAQFIPGKQSHSNILVQQPLLYQQIEPSVPQDTQQIHRDMAGEQYTSQEALQSSHDHQQPLDHSSHEFMTTQPTNHQNAHFTSFGSVGLQRSFSPSRMSPQLPSQFEHPDQHGTWQHQDINVLSESVVSLESSVTQQSIDSPSPGPVQALFYQEEEQPSYSSYQQCAQFMPNNSKIIQIRMGQPPLPFQPSHYISEQRTHTLSVPATILQAPPQTATQSVLTHLSGSQPFEQPNQPVQYFGGSKVEQYHSLSPQRPQDFPPLWQSQPLGDVLTARPSQMINPRHGMTPTTRHHRQSATSGTVLPPPNTYQYNQQNQTHLRHLHFSQTPVLQDVLQHPDQNRVGKPFLPFQPSRRQHQPVLSHSQELTQNSHQQPCSPQAPPQSHLTHLSGSQQSEQSNQLARRWGEPQGPQQPQSMTEQTRYVSIAQSYDHQRHIINPHQPMTYPIQRHTLQSEMSTGTSLPPASQSSYRRTHVLHPLRQPSFSENILQASRDPQQPNTHHTTVETSRSPQPRHQQGP